MPNHENMGWGRYGGHDLANMLHVELTSIRSMLTRAKTPIRDFPMVVRFIAKRLVLRGELDDAVTQRATVLMSNASKEMWKKRRGEDRA